MTTNLPAHRVQLADGRHIQVPAVISDSVLGVDRDGDLVVPLGGADDPIRHGDGTEYLIPLTPCCDATGKGCGGVATGVVCRSCYEEVDVKYGGPTTLVIARATTTLADRKTFNEGDDEPTDATIGLTDAEGVLWRVMPRPTNRLQRWAGTPHIPQQTVWRSWTEMRFPLTETFAGERADIR